MSKELKVLKDCELPTGFSENISVVLKVGDEIEHNGECFWKIKGNNLLFPHIPFRIFNKAINDGFLQEV